MARDYKSEYNNYHGTEKAKKQRARNNKARRKMVREGKASKGDGKDVAHKNNNTKDNSSSNLKVVSKSSNRSFPRDKKARRK